MLQLVNISKTYGMREGSILRPRRRTVKALLETNLTVSDKETLAILGPNGAGKSTLCKIAAGMLKPTTGQALLDGVDITQHVRSVSKRIGVVLGPILIYYRLTGYQYLRFFGRIYGVPDHDSRIRELAGLLNLEKWLDSHIESYSLGMKMKISMARALLHDPSLLILDEVSMGLDPVAAKNMTRLIKSLGKSIILTTHNTAEAEILADRIALLSNGKVQALDTLENLSRKVETKVRLVVKVRRVEQAAEMLRQRRTQFREEGGALEILTQESELSQLIGALVPLEIQDLQTKRPSLSDIYLLLTGEELTRDSVRPNP